MSQKKYASLQTLQNFLNNLKTIFADISHKHTIEDLTDYKVDTALSSTSVNPVQNKVIDAEFEAIATAMNALEDAIDGINESVSNIHVDWKETDETSPAYIRNKPAEMTEDDMLELLVELGAVDPISTIDNILYTNSSDQIYIL